MKSFNEFKKDVEKVLKRDYKNFETETDETLEFLAQEEKTLKEWYDHARESGRLETHYDVEVSDSAWGLDLLF